MKSLYQVKDGTLSLHPHPGQLRAWESRRRFVFIIAGRLGFLGCALTP